ncbi:peroxidase-related enzyme [Actinokineospora sp. NBRC 105648]|uniref:peroxidase-related enzyme n=1 Tax=Actinokineospora sp. NBRC 105648 TaxID=3032206 RepID=UPI0025560C0E|nr:peroxidase-related enzyme [Actinokineospora sp. NBRC 105648]
MRDRLGESLTIDDMARVARFSKFHFSRLFQRHTGVPPARFLSALRLAEAQRLLATTRLRVTDIGLRVGYHSPGTFSSRFKRHVGLSPTQYRLAHPTAKEKSMQENVPGVRVPLVAEAAATGRTAELYERARAATGLPFVPDVFRLTSTAPQLLEVVVSGYAGVFTESALSRGTKELVAAWTSRLNDCQYCVGSHNWFLQQFGGSAELAAAIAGSSTVDALPVDERTAALLRLTTATTTASAGVDDHWAAAAAAGWSEPELLEAVFCASLFTFINRLVTSLGLGAVVQQA